MKDEPAHRGSTKSRIRDIASELIKKYELPPDTPVHIDEVEVDEERCWEDAYKDFEGGSRPGLRAKLFTQFNGDLLKIKIEFIKIRAQELIELSTQQATDAIRKKLDAELAAKQEIDRRERERKCKASTEDDIEFVLKTRNECRPLLDRLTNRSYEIVAETISPNEQSWTVRSKTNGATFRLNNIEELRKLVF